MMHNLPFVQRWRPLRSPDMKIFLDANRSRSSTIVDRKTYPLRDTNKRCGCPSRSPLADASAFGGMQTMRPETERPFGTTRLKPWPFLCGQTAPISTHLAFLPLPSLASLPI